MFMSELNQTYSNVENSIDSMIVSSILFVLIILSSICGNVLVCAAICTDSNLRQLSNSLYVSLAVADLLVSSLVMTFATLDWIMGKWVFGLVFCNLFLSMDIMCSTASILNILATAIDRFVHVHTPFHYSRIFNKYFVGGFIGCIWIISAIMSFMPIHLGWHLSNLTVDLNSTKCMLQLNPSYAIISSVISFYLPCIIMVALYVKLYRFARMHTVKTNKTNDNSTTTAGCHRLIYKKIKTDQKAAVTLGVIMGTFLICWLPFFIINCVKSICQECISDLYFNIATWLGYFNSCLNPIIYPLFNTDFRNAYKKLIMRALCSTKLSRKKLKFSMLTNSFISSYNLNGASLNMNSIDEGKQEALQEHKCRSARSDRDPFSPVSQKFKNLYILKQPCLVGDSANCQSVILSNQNEEIT
uniref:GCR050 n=1 Tax=Schmidtea mediterranea TaxID=79327 RepID=A0A193KUM9_SCHMD|nr:GCR050 [Schmidtea mediterranea]